MAMFVRRTRGALGWVVAGVLAGGCATGASGSGVHVHGGDGGEVAGPDAAGLPGGGDTPDGGDRGGAPDAAGGDGKAPLINEFVANHTGTDQCEYVELIGTPGADYSRYAVLEVEGDGTGAGAVEKVYPAGTANRDGLWVTGMLTNELQNGTMTLLLVADFSGASDGSLDLDTNNDGTLDATPWSALVNAVAVSDGGASDQTYAGPAVLAANYDGTPGEPGGASRIPDGMDRDVPGDWVRNDQNGQGLSCDPGATAPSGQAINTPGSPNAVQL